MTAADDGAPITLDEALKQYGAALLERGAAVRNAQLPRYHLSDTLLSKPVTLITEAELTIWRGALLTKGLAPSTVNRVMNSLRAALTLADKTRVHIWRGGLKALPDATEANNVVIEDEAKAQQWVAASYAFHHQLGLLTHVLGETGARPSQAVRLRVRDLITIDPKAPRLMMPKSGKGGTRHPGQRKVERYAVSISPELAKLLKSAAKGRPSNAALLLRKSGTPWSETDPCGDYRSGVRSVVEKIGLDPDVYGLYAFRHSSITRMLLAGTHTAIVAKCHDTSEAMIRKHYAASILDYTDEITRKTLPALGPALQPAASNVVPLAKRP
jgi:integrase